MMKMRVAQTFICTDENLPKNMTGILFFDQLPDSINSEELCRLLRTALTYIADHASPCNEQLICEEAQMQSGKNAPGLAEISQTLCELGMPTNLLGYQYLRYAIHAAMREPEILRAMTKELYPQVAGEFRTTATGVERAMRHAIEVVWDRGNVEILESYFGYSVDPNRGKPTNSEFISKIVDNLTLNRMKTACKVEMKPQTGITA